MLETFIDQFSTLSIILLAIILGLTAYFHGPMFSVHTAHNAPSILTSLGIFGTFVGVAMGLMNFDTASIQASVPALIDGLKTAFWTSIAGLLGALTIKIRYALLMISKGNKTRKQGASLEDVVFALERVKDQMTLPGDENYAEQMLKSQQHATDQLQQLSQSLQKYQSDMTEANTQALIKAIEHVMNDFNAQIDQQYGENFRQLNESVGKMQVWQEQNHGQLIEMVEQQQASAQAMVEATNAFSTLVGQSHVFTQVAKDMETMLSGLHTQSQSLTGFMEKLSALVVNAQSGLPDLENRISQLTDILYNSVQTSQDQLDKMLSEVASGITETVGQVNSNLTEAVHQSQNLVNNQLKELFEQNDRQIKQLDEAMEAELAKALKTFGYQLTALSEKFVNDYTPLTDKLQDLVHMVDKAS